MSSVFNVADEQRLEREARLIEQLPRQPIEERPSDSILMSAEREAEEFSEESNEEPNRDFDVLLDGVLAALKRRI